MQKTATKVRDLPGKGVKALYRLNPPIEADQWDDDDPPRSFEHVVVSAVDAQFSGPETYIFGADENGQILEWAELPGSYRGGYDHRAALENAGYVVLP